MSYNNIIIEDNDGKKYHPQTNINNILGIEQKADKNNVVTSINEQKGDVVIYAGELEYEPGISMDEAFEIVTYFILEQMEYKADKDNVVTSVNGQKGDVVIYAGELEYEPGTSMDEIFEMITEWALEEMNYKADKNNVVTSINGQKGDVIIEGSGGESIRSSTIVIANYDSHENSKKGADIVIKKGENASKKINDAIQSLKGIGGEVKLMEGHYNLEYGIAVNVDGVHLTGVPNATILVQNRNWKDNPYNGDRRHIIDTRSDIDNLEVTISNLYVKGANIPSSYGIYCTGSSTVNNCISKGSGSSGFYCRDSSTVKNCISENSGSYGFYCWDSSTVNNCISESSGGDGFSCWGSSTVNNCISESSGGDGFYCARSFKGVCSFNILKGDKMNDNSSAPAVVEYNIIQEEVE